MEQKRGRGRPRKYFTLEEKEAAQKRYREAFEQRTRVKSLNIYGDDLDLLRELAKRSGMTQMEYAGMLIRKAMEDSVAGA
jgi:predicted ArsR family transcriptional regulator